MSSSSDGAAAADASSDALLPSEASAASASLSSISADIARSASTLSALRAQRSELLSRLGVLRTWSLVRSKRKGGAAAAAPGLQERIAALQLSAARARDDAGAVEIGGVDGGGGGSCGDGDGDGAPSVLAGDDSRSGGGGLGDAEADVAALVVRTAALRAGASAVAADLRAAKTGVAALNARFGRARLPPDDPLRALANRAMEAAKALTIDLDGQRVS